MQHYGLQGGRVFPRLIPLLGAELDVLLRALSYLVSPENTAVCRDRQTAFLSYLNEDEDRVSLGGSVLLPSLESNNIGRYVSV